MQRQRWGYDDKSAYELVLFSAIVYSARRPRPDIRASVQRIRPPFTDIRDPARDLFLSSNVLESEVSPEQVWNPQSSGIAINPEAATALDAHCKALPPIDIVDGRRTTLRSQHWDGDRLQGAHREGRASVV